MSRVRDYVRTTVYLLLFYMPPAWALRVLMQVARMRTAVGPNNNWPAQAVRWAVTDRKAGWRRRMFVWAQEVWLLTSGPRLGSAGVGRHVSVVGIEHIREAVRSGDGAIVLMAHQAGLTAVSWVLMEAGLPWTAVAYVPQARPNWVQQWWTRNWLHIRAFGARTLLHSDVAGIRQAYRRLRNGEVICMAQDVNGERYRGRFLRGDACLALGSVRMAMATGARLIPCSILPVENIGLQVSFRPQINATGGEGEVAAAVTRAVEELILLAPELWWTQFEHAKMNRNHGHDDQSIPQLLPDIT